MRGARRLAPIALAVMALTGCLASPPPQKIVNNATCLPPGRVLVVARVTSEGNRASAEAATASLVNVLRASSDVVGVPELSAEAGWLGLGVLVSGVAGRVQGGGRLTPQESQILLERFRITTLIISDLSEYDQGWGKYGKFTRATIDGQAVDLVGDTALWRVRGRAEVDEMRGRAFEQAMDQAVQQLAEGICPQPKDYSLMEAWRYWRR